jgi:SAM-dependent methyltransferase
MNMTGIDWNQVWKDGVIAYSGQPDNAAAWDGVAASMNATRNKGNYWQNVLERMKADPEWSVIDVGCGPGTLAIPMAKTYKSVTALDVSCSMLNYVRQNAAAEQLDNITCINKSFEETAIGTEVKRHDVVIASRSMGYVQDLKTFLLNMDAAAKKYAYLTWGTDERTFDIGVYKAIGRPYGDTRTYIVIYNLLYQLGIKANIELFNCDMSNTSHPDVESALTALRKRFADMNMNRELTKIEESRLIPYLKAQLVKTPIEKPRIAFHGSTMQNIALIWWQKDAGARRK